MTRLKLAFMGTPEFAVPSLKALVAAGHEIACVYTQPARPAGRGKKPQPSPVACAAQELGLPVRTPPSLKTGEVQDEFAALALDAAIVAAYGLILPPAILKAPKLGCINVHASLLPRWRGAAPIHRAIMAGDTMTGITIMQMDEGLDTGDILAVAETPIGATETTGQLHDRLADLGAETLIKTLEGLLSGEISPVPQPAAGVTYAGKIDKAESRIDWSRPAGEIARLVRGLAPWPGAWFEAGGERIKVLAGEVVTGNGAPGEILDHRALVACGEGAFRPTMLQRAGRVTLALDEFLRGFDLTRGSVLPGRES